MDSKMGCGSSRQTLVGSWSATPRPDQLAEPTVLTSTAPAIPGLVAAPNPSTPSTPAPVTPEGQNQKEFDDLKQAPANALKNVEDMKKKFDSSLPLSSTSGLPADSASAAALLKAKAAEQQLADLHKQIAALKTELEKANDAPQVEVQILTAQLAETNAAARGQPSDASLEQHFAEWQMFDGCLQALKQLDDTSLKEDFKRFAVMKTKVENSAAEEASTDALDKCRLSKKGLQALFAAKKKALSEAEVKELMLRIDTSGDGEVDWHEFRALVRSSSDLEMIFKALPLERVLAACFARGRADDPLQAFFSQQHSDVVAAVSKAGHIIVEMVVALVKKQHEARAKDLGGGGAKYGAVLTGGTVDKFFQGVTGICGEPHPEVERGMAEEHLLQPDSNEGFTTSNYAVSTTPAIEFGLVMKAMGISTGSASKVLQDFIKGGGKGSDGWLTRGEVTRKTITAHGQTLDKVLVSETRCCRQRGGQVPEDLRVLQPIEAFGDFGENGRLKSFLVCDTDTPLQKKVKRAGLTRMEVVAVVLYTGPCFMLYNGMLRGFGDCGEVPSDVESKSDAFWELLKKVSVKTRVERAGHKFSSTMHALSSGIKKIQAIAEDGQGTRLYRGLGGLDVRPFTASPGLTETAFMSSTRDLSVALEYSGAKDGKVATVIAIELSKLDNGADITDFSQYPGERETVWNTCAFLEYFHGRDEIHVTDHGVVRVLLVKANANTKALTVEELEGRRKTVVVGFLDTVLNDISRGIDAAVDTEQFQKRLQVDCLFSNSGLKAQLVREDKDFLTKDWKPCFTQSIKDESAARAKVYKDKDGAWFASNANLAQAVSDGLALSTLANAKRTLWLCDTSIGVWDMGGAAEGGWKAYYYNFQRAYGKLLARQRKELKEAEEAAAREGSGGAAAQRLKELALEQCVSRRWITGAEGLEDKDETTWCTPLLSHAFLGDVEVTERLLQARADPEARPEADREAVPTQGNALTALLSAAKEGNAEIALLLLKYKANLEATDWAGWTPLMNASDNGHVEAVRVLIEKGAPIDAATTDGATSLILASENGHVEAVRVLIEKGALIDAADEAGFTSLIYASVNGHVEAVRVLIEKGANLEAVTKDGFTSLMQASGLGHVEAVRVLIEKGANLEAADENGATSLILASQNWHVEAVLLLIEKGALIDATNKDGVTSLISASYNGHVEAVRVLIEKGANLEAATTNGATSLILASQNGHVEAVRVLIEKGALIDATNKDGWTPLIKASVYGHVEAVRVLIEKGANLEAVTEAGFTSLIYASVNGHVEAVRVLIEKGANLEAVTKGGMNALLIAEICGQSAVVAMLKEQYVARVLPLPVDMAQGKERVQKAWRDADNVVILDHVASGALYEDYTMVFGNFNTFKADVKLSAGKFYYELDIKHIQGIAQFGWATEGFESSTESTGEGVGDNAFSWGFDGVRVSKWGDGSSSAFGVEWQEGDVLGLACDMVNKTVSFSVNGSFEPPLGVAFENIVAGSIAPAFTASLGFKVIGNFGQLPLKHAPPDDTYVSVHAAAQK